MLLQGVGANIKSVLQACGLALNVAGAHEPAQRREIRRYARNDRFWFDIDGQDRGEWGCKGTARGKASPLKG
jgi:hypothetical protein